MIIMVKREYTIITVENSRSLRERKENVRKKDINTETRDKYTSRRAVLP